MPLSLTSPKKLQWKWVGITLGLYLVFYLLPLFMVGHMPASKLAVLFAGAWLFAGIIIIAAVAGYLSKGVTMWEPAIAGAVLYALCFIADATLSTRIALLQDLAPPAVTLALVFLISLYGAWWGENAQELWKTRSRA